MLLFMLQPVFWFNLHAVFFAVACMSLNSMLFLCCSLYVGITWGYFVATDEVRSSMEAEHHRQISEMEQNVADVKRQHTKTGLKKYYKLH